MSNRTVQYLREELENCKIRAVEYSPEEVVAHAKNTGVYFFILELIRKIEQGELVDD